MPSPDGLRFTVKAVGDFTSSIQGLVPGARLILSGPYGALTERARQGRKVLLVAGGVGIAPLRALLEGMVADPGDVTLVYRTEQAAQVIFKKEIDSLASHRGAKVHYVHGPSAAGAADPLDPLELAMLVPGLADHDAYVCGPPGMVAATVRSLRHARVDRRRIHTESMSF